MEDAGNSTTCWCTQLPPLPKEAYQYNQADINSSRCFCPTCLQALLQTSSTQKDR